MISVKQNVRVQGRMRPEKCLIIQAGDYSGQLASCYSLEGLVQAIYITNLHNECGQWLKSAIARGHFLYG